MDVQQTVDRVRDALAVDVRVVRFRDGERSDEPDSGPPDEVSILVADGSPATGFSTYSTVDASRFPTNVEDASGRRIASEFITVGRTGQRTFSDVLARCALAIAGGSVHVTPLTTIPDAVEAADSGHTMRHALLVAPFIWPRLDILIEEEPSGPEPGIVTTWLQVVPISDAELHYASGAGAQALFDRLERAGADVSDLDRASTI